LLRLKLDPCLVIQAAFNTVFPLQHALVGDAAVINRHTLGIQYPVSHGVVQDWDAMVSLWDYTFYEQLKVLPDSSRVLLTEPAFNQSHSRQRTLEIMFERYGFESALVHLGAALALYARGEQMPV
jgi:actin-related protein 2